MEMSDLADLTLSECARRLAEGDLDCASLTTAYLAQIDRLDGDINAIIERDPDALEIARRLDDERDHGQVRGPLHGVPILLKDNIDTGDHMSTTAGSLALEGSIAAQDAFVVRQLRGAGALILGKTNLSEWANMRSSRSSTGWSSRGGQTRNPFDLNRTPGGSSAGSGAAVAAGMGAAALGTETDGSVVIPAAMNALVGIKPTVGLVSRTGIIPISQSQDTAGPMTRTVEDAARLLGAMLGYDPEDPLSRHPGDLARALLQLSTDALQGARVGIARSYFGGHEGVNALMAVAIGSLRECGATIIDDVDLVHYEALAEAEHTVLCYELKAGLAGYFSRLGQDAPMKTLADVIEFNERHRQRVMPYFQQEHFIDAQACGTLEDRVYREALERGKTMAGRDGIDAAMAKDRLDVLIAPTIGAPWAIDVVNGDQRSPCCSPPAAVAGYPHITVPAGCLHGLPVGLSFFAGELEDAKVVNYAYAFEQHTQHRRAPEIAR